MTKGRPSRTIRRYAFATSLAMAAASCNVVPDIGLTSPGYCGAFLDQHLCVALRVDPATGGIGAWLLKGDTVRMFTYSDSGYGTPVTWSTSGDAVAAVPGSEVKLTRSSVPSASILIKGSQLGTGVVTAAHASPDRSASSTVAVADSSIITRIQLFSYDQSFTTTAPTARVGDSLFMVVTLFDSAGRRYGAKPEAWSTTDPTVATIVQHQTAPPNASVQTYVRARAPGAVDVIASFLAVRGTLRITVVP